MSPVSVLIPCHNAERYIGETLESVSRQTCRPAEVIVVDDGSTDRSRAIVESFAGVMLLDNVGQGASAARNRATAAATGEFLQYLDADDLLEPHALGARVEVLERTGADVAISDWQRMEEIDGEWRVQKTESGRLPDGVPADLAVFRAFWAPPAAILYRRSICVRIGGWRETLPIIQDARFLLDAARVHGQFVHVPGSGARYRQHGGGSLSTRSAARFWWDILRNAREVETLWQAENKLDAAHRAVLAEVYANCARVGFSEDGALFEQGRAELGRFPEHRPSRFLRAAMFVSRWTGDSAARAVFHGVRGTLVGKRPS